jgi:radical SAM superfamily enzyme YgiQ (UPF0313 family)
MKTISLVQVNFQQGPKELNAFFLPYSIGTLWSYAAQFQSINSHYQLNKLIFKRDAIDGVAQSLSSDSLVGFSTYVWNKNYNYALAKKLKELNPGVLVIFGGPEIPLAENDIFKKHPFIDVIVKYEGEMIFKNVLEALNNGDISQVPGLIINKQGMAMDTGVVDRINVLDELPSAYLSGVFDKIMEENPGIEWNAILETNRGCPYHCTFCNWGSLVYKKVKKYRLNRVYEEIEWFGKHKCGFISITDANFGIFLERDNLIVDKILEVQNSYGFPYAVTILGWAKNQKKGVFNIIKKLYYGSEALNRGLALSVQTLNEPTLQIIKRKNMETEKIEELFNLCNMNQVPILTELILGLPGETKETWKNNFWKLLDLGNHTGIEVYQAVLLENTELKLEQKSRYGMQTTTVHDYLSSSSYDQIPEGIEIIVSTDSMSLEDMIECQIFNWYLFTFHKGRITNFVSRFLRKYIDLDYKQFYDELYKYLSQKDWFRAEEHEIKLFYSSWMKKGQTDHLPIEGVKIDAVNINYRSIMMFQIKNSYDEIFRDIEAFLSRYRLDKQLITQLVNFQRNYIINVNYLNSYPLTACFDYNFYEYIICSQSLKKQPIAYGFDFNNNIRMSRERFISSIYYLRRSNFGKAAIKPRRTN